MSEEEEVKMTVLSLDITADLNALITKAARLSELKKAAWVRTTLRAAAEEAINKKAKPTKKPGE